MNRFTPWERGRLALDEGKLPSFQLVPCKFSPSVPAALAAGTTLGARASCPRRGRDALVPGVVRCKQVHPALRTSGERYS